MAVAIKLGACLKNTLETIRAITFMRSVKINGKSVYEGNPLFDSTNNLTGCYRVNTLRDPWDNIKHLKYETFGAVEHDGFFVLREKDLAVFAGSLVGLYYHTGCGLRLSAEQVDLGVSEDIFDYVENTELFYAAMTGGV